MDRIIGLDLGSKTCGVSICDALHITCRALTTVRFESDDYDACLEEVLKLLKENKVKEVVLGLPKHMNGDIGIRGEISCEFAKKLESSGITVHLWDERLTTVAAEKSLQGMFLERNVKKVIDQMAAVQILQSFWTDKTGDSRSSFIFERKSIFMLDSNSLYVYDEDGNEKKMTILFTFDSDETGCQYVVFQDPDNDEGEVFASRYDDKGQLIPIESEAEWEMVEEVINTFVEDEENAD